MKIQINSLAALERLIGGDSALEIEVRNSVVQEFVKRHLKALATSEPVKCAIEATRQKILDEVTKQCSDAIATFKMSYGGSITGVTLHASVQQEINRKVGDEVDRLIRDGVQSAVNTFAGKADLDERIAKRFEYYANDIINAKIKERLEAIKAKL